MNYFLEFDIFILYILKYMVLVNVGDRQIDKKNIFIIIFDEDFEFI